METTFPRFFFNLRPLTIQYFIIEYKNEGKLRVFLVYSYFVGNEG